MLVGFGLVGFVGGVWVVRGLGGLCGELGKLGCVGVDLGVKVGGVERLLCGEVVDVCGELGGLLCELGEGVDCCFGCGFGGNGEELCGLCGYWGGRWGSWDFGGRCGEGGWRLVGGVWRWVKCGFGVEVWE